MKIRLSFVLFLAGLTGAAAALAGIPFQQTPDWISTDMNDVSTGGALVDLDRDGWLDLVVANGNDMARQPLVVYYNRGDGTFPATADWSSQAVEYHGQLDTGDVNGDGWPDVAVAVYLGPGGFSDPGNPDPGKVVVYLNDGTGHLPDTPSWESADRFFCFCVALGDADGDGDLDLAAAVGESYNDVADRNRIYYNRGGVLDTLPGWVSDEVEMNMGVTFGDADNDGDLDLAFSADQTPHRVYFQEVSGLETSSGWQSATIARMGNQVSLGDIDRDGTIDLAVAENNQLGGEGRFRVFFGGPGGLSTTAGWASNFSGYGADAVIGDANGDGWPDLVCGSWGSPLGGLSDVVRIYSNRYLGPLEGDPNWVSATRSVNEKMILGDVNNDGLHSAKEVFSTTGGKKLFYLRRVPVQAITRVTADGVPLAPNRYCFKRESGWISLGQAPANELEVDYTYSTRNDMVVTNWDAVEGNYLFLAIPPIRLTAVRGQTGTELHLLWEGGNGLFDLLESGDTQFGPGLQVPAESLDVREWSDLPGTIGQGGLTFYRVY
jgi:hypothetical protein